MSLLKRAHLEDSVQLGPWGQKAVNDGIMDHSIDVREWVQGMLSGWSTALLTILEELRCDIENEGRERQPNAGGSHLLHLEVY